MTGASRTRIGAVLMTAVFSFAFLGAARAQSGRGLSVRWIGQDGQDYVAASGYHEPDDRADVHLTLSGLDPRREVAFIDITVPNGHRWQYNPLPGYWHAHLARRPGSATADVWVSPIEMAPGTVCRVLVRYGDGTTAEAAFRSRPCNVNQRPTSAMVRARWVGQEPRDLAGPGAAVGPDGRQDAFIHLDGLSTRFAVKGVRLEVPGGARWESGHNPLVLNGAELIKNPRDSRQADFAFQPDRDLTGVRMRLTVTYEGAPPDVVAVAGGRCDPAAPMPRLPLPKVEELTLGARWLGQDGSDPSRPGDVHVALDGLPGPIVAAEMSDTVRETWSYRASDRVDVRLGGRPGSLAVRFRPEGRSADLHFAPYRDTTREIFSIRLVGSDGRTWHGQFPGGPSDLARLSPMPDATRAEAHPGDDLQTLLDRNGTVVLAAGTYRLSRPLVLARPATLTGKGDATLLFRQDPGDRPWGTVIKVRRGNTTLEGFSVRFEGPVRWDPGVSYGAAVIGMTEGNEAGSDEPKNQVVFRNLDVEAPPADDPTKWVEAPRMLRLVGAMSGAVIGNRLRGGTVEFFHGPWRILDNEFRGTPPGIVSPCVLGGHFTHDLLIRGNRVSSPPPSGKTWRFLVLTGSGVHDRVERNVIEGIGDRDGDTIPWSNAPEIILTENYWLKYEGGVMELSDDGRVVRIGTPQGADVQAGDVVAILGGPEAGNWRRVAHVLEPSAVLLDRPLPSGTGAVSVSQGFVSEVFEQNRIDIRGGHRSDGFVLAGNHYGTRVVGNQILGGGLSWRIMASPTESPMSWGWSHGPFLGGVVSNNILEDAERGGEIGVEHSIAVRTNRGRTYMSVGLDDNVVRWSGPFLVGRRRQGADGTPPGLIAGYRPSADPGELLVTATGNKLDAPAAYRDAPALLVHAARFNTRTVVDRRYRLPAWRGAAVGPRREAAASSSPER